MENYRILIADDDPEIVKIASRALTSQGFLTTSCDNGFDAYQNILHHPFDLILLDITMDKMDGFEVIKKVRDQKITTPIMVITGNDEEYNEIYGFSLGADDYIIKPFRPSALCARVKALFRRLKLSGEKAQTLNAGPFIMDLHSFSFYKNGEELSLTPKERSLMQCFLEHPNQLFSKEQLFQLVWKSDCVDDNTIMVSIRNLRQKIEDDPKHPLFITTVYGIGYRFTIPK